METFNKIFTYVSKYNPMSVGVEVTGQRWICSCLKMKCLREISGLAIARGRESNKEGIAVRTNKMDRI